MRKIVMEGIRLLPFSLFVSSAVSYCLYLLFLMCKQVVSILTDSASSAAKIC